MSLGTFCFLYERLGLDDKKINHNQSSRVKFQTLPDTNSGALKETTGYALQIAKIYLLKHFLFLKHSFVSRFGGNCTPTEQNCLCNVFYVCEEQLSCSYGVCNQSRHSRRGKQWGEAGKIWR